MFNERRERSWLPFKSKLFDVLLNYVLSPALLIYAVILYLYFIKIAVLWSLPKGAVASIVVSFTAAAFILKGCQVFLTRRYYDWFYDHASLAVFPALVMFWIGTLYRIYRTKGLFSCRGVDIDRGCRFIFRQTLGILFIRSLLGDPFAGERNLYPGDDGQKY